MTSQAAWTLLGIAPTSDRAEIRRAYARCIKRANPEDDPEAFQALRDAYERALQSAANGGVPSDSQTVVVRLRRDTDPREDRKATYLAAFATLRRLLVASDDLEAGDLIAAFDRAVAAMLDGDVAIQLEGEEGLAELLASTIPRADPVLARAVAQFRWDADDALAARRPSTETIVVRAADVRFRDDVREPRHRSHRALAALERFDLRPTPLTRILRPVTTRRTRELLDTIRLAHPSLLADLDPRAVAAWTTDADHLPTPAWVKFAVYLGAVDGSVVAIVALHATRSMAWLVAVLALPLPLIGLPLFDFVALRLPRHAWRRHRARVASSFERFGWAPCAFALLLAAAIVPPSPIASGMLIASSLAVAYWALLVGDAAPEAGWPLWARRLTYSRLFLLVLWFGVAAFTAGPALRQACVAFAAAFLATIAGSTTLFEEWYLRTAPTTRRRFATALALLAVTSLLLGGIALTTIKLSLLAVTLFATAVLANQIPLPGVPKRNRPEFFGGRYGWVGLLLVPIVAGAAVFVVPLIGMLFLLYQLVRTVQVTFEDTRG